MLTPEEVTNKLAEIESDLEKLIAENKRLIRERESTYVELDTCVSLIAQLAVKNGFTVGLGPNHTVVIDLPVGQVSWEFAESEAHLFASLSPYPNPIEELDAQEKYARVMNPGL